MKRLRPSIVCGLAFVSLMTATPLAGQARPGWLEPYVAPASRLIEASLADTFAWQRLADLTDTVGNRLSGSPQLEQAVEWAVSEMKRDGLDNVHTEPVKVPKWVRGRESADIISPTRQPLTMLGLGDSVGTPASGIQAEALVVRSFDEL